MNTKLTARRCFWVAIVALLFGCTPLSPQPIATSAPTLMPVRSSPITSPTFTPFPTPLPVSLTRFPLSGYVMIFVKNGDLYFQDGNNSPVKLADVGEKSYYPKLSDDNRKVIFSRDDGNEYSINTDGTQEQIIIPNDWLASFEPGTEISILGFIPATHQLLVETYFCESQKFESPCSTSLFLANIDTGIIEKLIDLGLALQQNSISRNIEVSPDGKMVAFGTMQGVGIITIAGKIVRNNILPYKSSTSISLFPSLFLLPDSSGLIVALPNTSYSDGTYFDMAAYSIWRYMIDLNTAVQISFSPMPLGSNFQVSPDAKWITYDSLGEYDAYYYYLGNLANGHLQVIGPGYSDYFHWSPDSRHFIADAGNTILGSVDSPNTITVYQVWGDEWVDATHFISLLPEENGPRRLMAEIDSAGGVKIYDLGFGEDFEASLLIKPK